MNYPGRGLLGGFNVIRGDQDRHVMRPTRLPARDMAAAIRWFCAGNNPTWPKAPDRCAK
jgi:hypothetical protein